MLFEGENELRGNKIQKRVEMILKLDYGRKAAPYTRKRMPAK